jgi:hypothetical protein
MALVLEIVLQDNPALIFDALAAKTDIGVEDLADSSYTTAILEEMRRQIDVLHLAAEMSDEDAYDTRNAQKNMLAPLNMIEMDTWVISLGGLNEDLDRDNLTVRRPRVDADKMNLEVLSIVKSLRAPDYDDGFGMDEVHIVGAGEFLVSDNMFADARLFNLRLVEECN